MESLTPHSAYIAMLENISPFIEDFDSEHTNFRRMLSALNYATGTMDKFAITIKGVYGLLLNDQSGYEKINQIMLKYNPDLNNVNITKEFQEKFRKK